MNNIELAALRDLISIAVDYCVEFEKSPTRVDDVWSVVRVLENYLDKGEM